MIRKPVDRCSNIENKKGNSGERNMVEKVRIFAE